MSRASRAAHALFALLFSGTARAAAPRTPLGADTPQAVVERMAKASVRKDVAEFFACLDPESRAEGTTGLLLGVTTMLAFMDSRSGAATDMAGGLTGSLSEESTTPENTARLDQDKARIAAKSAKLKVAFSIMLKKHGLPDLLDPAVGALRESPETLLATVDQPALAAELVAFMKQLGDTKEAQQLDGAPVPRDVSDYKITGDRATARSGPDVLEFVRVGGRWYYVSPLGEHDDP